MAIPNYDLIIYHAPCFDGFTAAWVAHQHFPDAEYLPAKYGQAPPDVTDRTVLVVDFSYPREVLEDMHLKATHLQVLDHHATAAEDLKGLPYAEFDMERSGAGMCWDHLNPGQERPRLVHHVEDRDLWRFKDPDTLAFHAALTLSKFTFDDWTQVHETVSYLGKANFLNMGRVVLRQLNRLAEVHADRCVPLALDIRDDQSLETWAVDVPVELVSETAHTFLSRSGHEDRVFLGFRWDGLEGDWYCSLRSLSPDGPDVGALAQEFGGGGHKHSAGFRHRFSPPTLASCGGAQW